MAGRAPRTATFALALPTRFLGSLGSHPTLPRNVVAAACCLTSSTSQSPPPQSRCASSIAAKALALPTAAGFWQGLAGVAGLGGALGYYIHRMRNPKPQLPFGDPTKPTVVVLGSGWASMSFVNRLDTKEWNVVVVSPRNYFLFTPLLPSCTVGTLELRSLMLPMRFITGHKARAVNFIEGEAIDVDPVARTVQVKGPDGLQGIQTSLQYDFLVVGVGASTATFGIKGVEEHAVFLKEITDAQRIRRTLLDRIEAASFPGLPSAEVDRLLHMVVVGGGPTGVEYAAELRDFVEEDLAKWFPELAGRVRITLVEAAEHVLASFDQTLQNYTEKHFAREDITLRTNTIVKEVREKEIVVSQKRTDGGEEVATIPFGLLVWAAGNGTRPLITSLRSKLPPDLQAKRQGLDVDDFLAVKGAERVYSLGDCAASSYAATAQVASQQGIYLGRLFTRLGISIREAVSAGKTLQDACEDALQSRAKEKGFAYTHRGSLAYIGTDQAIADLPGGSRFAGVATFLFWRSFYLSSLFTARNKTLVAFDWTKKILFGRDIARE